jgi:hypothetical protein
MVDRDDVIDARGQRPVAQLRIRDWHQAELAYPLIACPDFL